MSMSRRTFMKGITWSTPAIVVSTAAPAVATSALKSRIEFTNTTATVGKSKNTIYANTKVKVIDGPEPVTNLSITVCVEAAECQMWTYNNLQGWGVTELLSEEWVVSGMDNYLVTFRAEADGVEPISASVTVEAPGWWE